MPSIFNPVTGKAERASKQQKEAYDEYKQAELIKTLLGSQFGVPTIGVASALILGPIVAAFILKETGKKVEASKWQDYLFGETGISESLVKRFFNISGDTLG